MSLDLVVQSPRAAICTEFRLSPACVSALPVAVTSNLRWHTARPDFESQPVLGLPIVAAHLAVPVARADLEKALVVAKDACRPGGPADCLEATARLSAVARRHPTVTADEELALAVYAEKLAKYPADAVAAACERWMEISPFWPSVSEILKMTEWAMQPRRELVRALESALRGHRPLRAVAGRSAHG